MIVPAPHRRLRELLAGLVPVEQDCEIRGLSIDSRRVQPGDLFFAWPGERVDGRGFMREAAAQGAAAIVYETNGETVPALDLPTVALPQLRRRAGAIADRFYGAPSRQLTVVGVTGTNGKTTCTQLLAQTLSTLSRRCGVIGTLGFGYPGALNESLHTTPDAVTVHRLLAGFLAEDARAVAMEVSSHALDQGRVTGVQFDVAVFTNLTRDHLDYHGDMVAYGAAKATLFDWPNLKHAIINADDVFGRELIERLGARVSVVSYGIEQGMVRATHLSLTRDGIRLHVATPQGETALHSPLFGRFNAHNLLAVLATLLTLDVSLTEAAAALARARPAAGRMEHFGGSGHAPLVVVDYAHTPDALEKVLQTLREHTTARLLCVFGCGGNRDRGKRPLMGRIAETLADEVILTDDNPRHEDGQAIIDEIRSGMLRTPRVIRDRRAAIAQALALAGPADIVLVAGKGHEDYQQLGDERRPYSDRATVRELLEAMQ